MKTIDQILNLYVAKDDRAMLQNPFIQDGYVYAANGHIMIRVKDASLLDNPMYREQSKPQSSHLFDGMEDAGTITMTNILELKNKVELIDELELDGENVKCDECDGWGEVEWEYDRWTKDFDCPACDGSGYSDKETYNPTGRKITNPEGGIFIVDRHFKVKLVDVLLETMQYFNVDVAKIQRKQSQSSQMLFHLNDNVTVLLMPYLKNLD